MSETILWTCDRCKKTWNSSEHGQSSPLEMISIGVGPLHLRRSPPGGHVAQWCEACMIATHIIPPADTPADMPPPEPLTLEEMVREIVREEIDEQ